MELNLRENMLSEDADDDIESHDDLEDDLVIMRFETEKHLKQFRDLIYTVERLCAIFTCCNILLFWSSSPWKLQGPRSQIDAIILSIDVALLDVSSAFFVVCGALCALVFDAVKKDQSVVYEPTESSILQNFKDKSFKDLISRVIVLWNINGAGRIILIDVMLDIFLSTNIGILLHVLCNALYNDFEIVFDFKNWIYNAFVAVTAFNVFDASPTVGLHLVNFQSWLPCILIWCVVLLPNISWSIDRIVNKFGIDDLRIMTICNILSVCLVTLMSKLQQEKNIAYISFNSLFYRVLEFSIGINLYRMYILDDVLVHMCARLLHIITEKILMVFLMMWTLHIGCRNAKSDLEEQQTCARLYFFSNCLPSLSLPPLFGNFLGCVLTMDSFHTHTCMGSISRCRNQVTSIMFACPISILVRLAMAVNFEKTTVHVNDEMFFSFVSFGVLCLWVIMYNDMRCFLRKQVLRLAKSDRVNARVKFCFVNMELKSNVLPEQDVDF